MLSSNALWLFVLKYLSLSWIISELWHFWKILFPTLNDCISYKNELGPLKLGEMSYIWVGSIHDFLENIPSRSENPNKNNKIPRWGGGILIIIVKKKKT